MTTANIGTMVNYSPSLIQVLREGTLLLHRDIESHVPLLRPDLTIVQYGSYLTRIVDLYRSVEDQFDFVPDELRRPLELARRKKLAWLHADLDAIVSVPNLEPNARPRSFGSSYESVEAFIGTLYVIEGATLGGRFIHRALKHRLGLPDNQLRFFWGYGDETKVMWSRFCSAAEERISPAGYQVALTAAVSAFHLYKACVLDKPNISSGDGG